MNLKNLSIRKSYQSSGKTRQNRFSGVQIHIPPFLQSYTDNTSRDDVGGDTILECLRMLVEHFPQLKSRLFDSDDKLSGDLNIYHNDTRVYPRELSRPVKDGDRLFIAHVIVGG
jgi:molybdopterin synthase sulfur carrier subunit